MNNVLLTLIARPDAEEIVIDWLLGRDELSGFTGEAAWGHSREHGRFSLVERDRSPTSRRVPPQARPARGRATARGDAG